MSRFAKFVLAVVGLVIALPASAVIASIDEFGVIKNGNQTFLDTFDDGAEPPSAPNFLAAGGGGLANYFLTGTIPANAESGGKLTLNSSDGGVITTSTGTQVFSDAATLNTNIDPNNFVNGLKSDDTLSISGVFDLVSNGGPLYSGYGIFLNDGGNGLGRLNEVNVQVSYSTTLGVDIIRLTYQDFDAGTSTVIGFFPVNSLLGADQIRLTLSRSDINTFDLIGSYEYLLNGQVVGGATLGTASIFQDRNYVRAGFFASSLEVVPEPSVVALLSLGLAGLALSRRRRR